MFLSFLQTGEVDVDAPQTVLHDLVFSLYAKVITMDAASFEDMIALANYLQVRNYQLQACL